MKNRYMTGIRSWTLFVKIISYGVISLYLTVVTRKMKQSAIKNLPDNQNTEVLGPLFKLYVYGLHGYLIEIMFTAGWEFVVNLNWKLPGCSSIWSLPIYGVSGLVMEKIYLKCCDMDIPLLLRGLCYLVWVYLWEFTTGYFLTKFNACPWDYSIFTYNICGLITLEYAPLWFFISLMSERFLIFYLSDLRWTKKIPKDKLINGTVNKVK